MCSGGRNVLGLYLGLGGLSVVSTPATASPAMIRLGYSNCQACHLSPQGRGLLTEYGKGIDDAQSARKGVYTVDGTRLRRVFHDLRLQAQGSALTGDGTATDTSGVARLWYRNATALTRTMRVGAMVTVDAPARGTQTTAVQPLPSQPEVFLRQALWEYAPRHGLHVAVGRDTLPSGLEIADQATSMRARNTQGLTDVPTQAKVFVSTRRFQLAPYA